jgi:hypothetical protein
MGSVDCCGWAELGEAETGGVVLAELVAAGAGVDANAAAIAAPWPGMAGVTPPDGVGPSGDGIAIGEGAAGLGDGVAPEAGGGELPPPSCASAAAWACARLRLVAPSATWL